MVDNSQKPAEDTKRPKQGRSPSYPSIDLKAAIAKAKALYDQEGKYPAPMSSAFGAWGYSAKSSGGRETRASLRYFGLITVEGDGETGKVKLTDKALRVLLDEREDKTEKLGLIRELALTPAIHKRIHDQFPNGIKSDATVEHFLMFDEGFNKVAAAAVVAEFKATAEFSGLYKSDIAREMPLQKPAGNSPREMPSIGDFVQVEIDGVFKLEKPARLRAVKDHQGQNWGFVEGSETGFPIEQLVLQSKGDSIVVPPTLPEGRSDRVSLAAGEREWLRGPLSKDTSYRLIIAGHLGPKEIGKLIKLLKAQQAVLLDEDDEDDSSD